VEAALAELLLRTALDRTQPGDQERGRALLRRLARDDVDALVLGAAAAGVADAFDREPRLDADVHATALTAARALTHTSQPPHRVILGATALVLSARAGRSERRVDDLLLAALAARNVEQHSLCADAARLALGGGAYLSTSQRARAWLLLALVERDDEAIKKTEALIAELASDDPTRVIAEAVWPTLGPSDPAAPLSEAGEAIRRNDRPAAAASLADTFRELSHTQPADQLLAGLVTTMDALARPHVDVANARRGFAQVIRHWREHRRIGDIPAIAKAGIEIALDLLTLEPGEGGSDLLCETLEALADSGLSSLDRSLTVEARDAASAAVAHATLAARASGGGWPNLAWIANRLQGTNVLLTRTQRRWTDGATEVLALHVNPPNELSIKKAILDAERAETLERFASEQVDQIAPVTQAELDQITEMILPRTLQDAIAEASVESLLVIADGPLWAVPWRAATLCATPSLTVTICPSMSVWAALEPPTEPVRSILAFVDPAIAGAEFVLAALDDAQTSGSLRVSWAETREDLQQVAHYDLLLIFAHGAGTGLNYQLALRDRVSAHDIATSSPPQRALIAGCWSAGIPPISFPLSVPAALLLNGCKTVVGGLWPLPAIPTAALTAALITALANDHGLVDALRAAVNASNLSELLDHAGLAAFGRADPVRTVRSR
jgi:hypothetical protein